MNIINQLPLAVLISSVTSTLLLSIWKKLQGFFIRTDPKMIYTILRFICITYMLPFGYVIVLFTYRVWLQGELPMWKMVFLHTDFIAIIIYAVVVIWFVKAYREGKKQYIGKKNLLRMLEDNIPIVEDEIFFAFEKVCSRLNIRPNKVALFKNPLTDTPLIVNARRPQIVLPEQDYTQEELELIFYHELSHYMHHDLIYKSVASVICIIHCINPFVNDLQDSVEFWSECMADVSALELSGNLPYAREYYDQILSIVSNESKPETDKYFFSALCKDAQEAIIMRINFLTQYQHSKFPSKIVTALLAVLFVSISISTAFVSGKVVAGVYNLVYRHTEVKTNETGNIALDKQVEYTCREEDLAIDSIKSVISLKEEVEIDGGYKFEDSMLETNTRYLSCSYRVKAGHKIRVCITIMPSVKSYLLGIIDEDGNARYIKGTGSLEHIFSITKDSSYCVFIQNNCVDGTDLYVKEHFYFQNKDDKEKIEGN